MAIEYIDVLDGTGAHRKVAADVFNTDEFAQVFKLAHGPDGTVSLVEPAAPLPTYAHGGGAYFDENGNKLTVKRAKASVATGQSNATVIAAVTNKKLRVLALVVQCGSIATTVVFNSNTTAISMTFQNAANGGAVLDRNDLGWFETDAGQPLTMTTGGSGSTTQAQIVYVEV